MTPIAIPHDTDPSWNRARTIVAAFRAKGKANPLIVAAIVNGLAEAAWKPLIVGDHGQSFGPWQLKDAYYGEPIRAALGIDIRTEPDLTKHVDAVIFALRQARVLPALEAAKTGEEGTRIWAAEFERASAGGAVERRVAIAPKIEVWISEHGG